MMICKRNVNKKIIIFTAVILIIVLFCCLKMVQKNREYHFDNILVSSLQQTGDEAGAMVVYENISLPVGVYRVALDYTTDRDMNYHVTMEDGGVFTGALQTNGESLYSGLSSTDFHMWLYENTESMQLKLSSNGAGTIGIGALHIYETNKLWTMLLTSVISIYAFIMLLIYYRAYGRNNAEVLAQKTVVCGLLFIVLLASVPYLWGICTGRGDTMYHLQRIEGVKDGLLSGMFPVRIEPEWVHGHGYASAIFYCNALLIFPAILRLLGFTVIASYNAYCIMLNVLTVLISYYCFSKIFKSRQIGLACAALYTLSIARIYKLMVIGVVGEGSAMTFMPLIFYGIYRALTEDTKTKEYKTAWLPIALGYAGVLQTHVLTCEITAFLTIIVCFCFVKQVLQKPVFIELAKGAIGAFLLSLWYLIPFVDYYFTQDLHIKHVSGRTIQYNGLSLWQLFLHYWKVGDNTALQEAGILQTHPLGVGFILAMAVVAFLLLWFFGAFQTDRNKQITAGKVSAILACVLMLMSLKIFPWDKIQQMGEVASALISSLQFPNRFLGWATMFLVAVMGCILYYLHENQRTQGYRVALGIIVISIMTSGVYLIDSINIDEGQFKLYNEEGMGFGYISGEEYKIEGTNPGELLYNAPAAEEGVKIKTYQKHYLKVSMSVENTMDKEAAVELPLTNYKGYKAFVAEQNSYLPIQTGTNGVVSVCVPPHFEGEVVVSFVSPSYWRATELISYLSWLFLAVYVYKTYGTKIRKGKKNVEAVCNEI